VPPALASHVYHAAQLSLANGMQAVLYAMAGVMGAAAVVAWFGCAQASMLRPMLVRLRRALDPGQ